MYISVFNPPYQREVMRRAVVAQASAFRALFLVSAGAGLGVGKGREAGAGAGRPLTGRAGWAEARAFYLAVSAVRSRPLVT